MIELTKVKTDVINYGAMKVYNTFLVISQDEVDPELFTQKQLEDIFAKKYDIIKVNIDFVVDEENEVVEHECLVFKLGKASDSTVTYMSNVNNEGSLSSLVLTKENDEVSLEVVEYSLGGGGTKLYKHQIELSDYPTMKKLDLITGNETDVTPTYANKKLVLITLSNEPMTNLNISSSDIINAIAMLGTSQYNSLVYMAQGIFVSIACSSSTASNYQYRILTSGLSITSDTVTPL